MSSIAFEIYIVPYCFCSFIESLKIQPTRLKLWEKYSYQEILQR